MEVLFTSVQSPVCPSLTGDGRKTSARPLPFRENRSPETQVGRPASRLPTGQEKAFGRRVGARESSLPAPASPSLISGAGERSAAAHGFAPPRRHRRGGASARDPGDAAQEDLRAACATEVPGRAGTGPVARAQPLSALRPSRPGHL